VIHGEIVPRIPTVPGETLLRGGFYKDVAPTALNRVPTGIYPMSSSKKTAWESFAVAQDFAAGVQDFMGSPGISRQEVRASRG